MCAAVYALLAVMTEKECLVNLPPGGYPLPYLAVFVMILGKYFSQWKKDEENYNGDSYKYY